MTDIIDVFCEATNLKRPESWGGKEEKWLVPMRTITDAAGDQSERAVREAVKHCRKNNILIASPASIEAAALHMVANWRSNVESNEPTQADFDAYRRRVVGLGYNVLP